ncbi:MAG: acyl-CoA dehydrogenase family protein [Clostridia bacterium]|nr:acyl-CoA dehydrogenase family protein [Clostridia bacterium]
MNKFNDEEQMILSTIDQICEEKVLPRAAEIDATDEFPEDLRQLFAEQGIYSLIFEEQYGGVGASLQCYCAALQKFGRVSGSVSMMVAVHSLGSTPIILYGSEEMKERVFPRLASGEALIAFALTELAAGSDVNRIASTAVKKGDKYIINGSKCFITGGSVADYFCVFAQVIEAGEKKLSVFLVEKDQPGVQISRNEEKMGLKGSPTTQLYFENVEVTEDNIIGKISDGAKIAFNTLNKGRLCTSAQAIGIAQGALDVAAEYAKGRVQFGKSIAEFQAVQLMLADMETDIQAARALLEKSIEMYEAKSAELVKFSSMTKLLATDMVMRVTTNAVQVMGGYGYCKDYPVERMMRDSKIFAIFEGTNQIQRILIAKQLLSEY